MNLENRTSFAKIVDIKKILKSKKTKNMPKRKVARAFKSLSTHPEGIRSKNKFIPWPALESKQFPLRETIWVDESGSGPLCGPLNIAATFIYSEDPVFEMVHDSKLLRPTQRDHVYDEAIKVKSLVAHVESVPPKVIDAGKTKSWKCGVSNAVVKCIQKAKEKWPEVDIKHVVIDGNLSAKQEDETLQVHTIVNGDSLFTGIALASIMAKVTRDRYMVNIAEKYPQFTEIFRKSKGYGTRQHMNLLRQGIYTDIHRKSYNPLKTFLMNKESL